MIINQSLFIILKRLYSFWTFSLFGIVTELCFLPPGQPWREQPHGHGRHHQPRGWQLRWDPVHPALRQPSKEHCQPRRRQWRPQCKDHPRAPGGGGEAEGATHRGRGSLYCSPHRCLWTTCSNICRWLLFFCCFCYSQSMKAPELKDRLEESEKLIQEMTVTWEDKLRKTEAIAQVTHTNTLYIT